MVGSDGNASDPLRNFRQNARQYGEPRRLHVERGNERKLTAQRLDQALIRKSLGEPGRSGERAAAGFLDRVPELAHQPRLADAGLAADEHNAAALHLRAAPRLGEPFDLAFATAKRQRAVSFVRTRLRSRHRLVVIVETFTPDDALGQRGRLGHRIDVHFFTQANRKLPVFRDRSGCIAGLVAQARRSAERCLRATGRTPGSCAQRRSPD